MIPQWPIISPTEIIQKPVSIKELGYTLIDKPYGPPRADWHGLFTCACQRKSPDSIDKVMQDIADDLGTSHEAVIIDFGSGGCLPLLSLVSRLSKVARVVLYLVDQEYTPLTRRDYQVTSKGILNWSDHSPKTDCDTAIVQFLQVATSLLEPQQLLEVRVVESARQALALLKQAAIPAPHVLYTLDPMRTLPYVKAFSLLTTGLQDLGVKPQLYCLNLLINPNPRIPRDDLDAALKYFH